MKYVFNFFTTLFIGWPALIAGYICEAARSGFGTGRFLYEQGETAAIEKFTAKKNAAKD